MLRCHLLSRSSLSASMALCFVRISAIECVSPKLIQSSPKVCSPGQHYTTGTLPQSH